MMHFRHKLGYRPKIIVSRDELIEEMKRWRKHVAKFKAEVEREEWVR